MREGNTGVVTYMAHICYAGIGSVKKEASRCEYEATPQGGMAVGKKIILVQAHRH
jgi:hypothetical protein